MKSDSKRPYRAIEVVARLMDLDKGQEKPKLVAHAFSNSGRLLASEPLDDGKAKVSVPESENPQTIRVFIGPREAAREDMSISELRRLGAEEQALRLDPDSSAAVSVEIFRERWLHWLAPRCCVPGTLKKWVETDGIWTEAPVCHAVIEIYEVDPLWRILPRVPELELERIRDIILDPTGPLTRSPRIPDVTPNLEPIPQVELEQQIRSVEMPASLQFAAKLGRGADLRRELLAHPEILRPLLCWFYPTVFSLTKICETKTDECGRFRCCFWHSYFNPDAPDLYFKAYRQIGPFKIPIYAPTPIGCHTRWNYSCGAEVHLHTTSPFALTCAPCPPVEAPDNWVLVMAIGNLSLARVRGASAGLAGSTNASNIGLVDDLAKGDRPFGGLLRPRLEFDNSLRDSLGVHYYSVSWREGTSGPFQPLNQSVNRHYIHEVGSDVVIDAYNLGPKTVGIAPNEVPNLYEIPPSTPPKGQWSLPNVVEDTANAYFPTADIAPPAQAGKYQLKIDLHDANGQPVNLAASGIKFVVPNVENLSGTITTEDASSPTLNLVSGNSFILTLHVDNNPCVAALNPPTIAGTPASDVCGVLEYTAGGAETVTMDFAAAHPNGFATFDFDLVRGASNINANLDASSSIGGAVGSGSHNASGSAANLLGACAVAGFAEHLHVDATATNGWSDQNHLDAHAVRAFVLAPKNP